MLRFTPWLWALVFAFIGCIQLANAAYDWTHDGRPFTVALVVLGLLFWALAYILLRRKSDA